MADDDDEDDDDEVSQPEQPAADGKKASNKRTCSLSPDTITYLEKLVKIGTHGSTFPHVMRRLIEDGVRQAIRDDFIKKLER